MVFRLWEWQFILALPSVVAAKANTYNISITSTNHNLCDYLIVVVVIFWLNANLAFLQLYYHGEKFIFNEMMMRSALY